ncbi:MAG: glutamate racemase [Proteobacteria bacterium]|nr:glutamate racemase [Pseudomonadota bacterium]
MSLSTNKDLPIGVFDSGIGGLTVLRALQHALPHENFLYLGDTARLPYGTKSPQTVKDYALNANEILVATGVKALVVACNTATAVALDALQEKFQPLPVLGVIAPGAIASLEIASEGPIVVLATESTAKWHAYRDILSSLAPERTVIEWPCQLLVALAEEGWCEGPLVEEIISKLLSPLFAYLGNTKPACILLGCTHFPVLKSAMQHVVGTIPVIDPAHTLAAQVITLLSSQNLLRAGTKQETQFMATDGIERFARVAQTFLGYAISSEDVELVTVIPKITTAKKANTA